MAAEVRFQPGGFDPIPNGATPSSSSRLSQRNLAIVESDNPGTIASHTVQHTVLLKPSQPKPRGITSSLLSAASVETGDRFDELVIRWHDLPRDTQASFYCPDWDAEEILAVANTLRPGPQKLSKIDANTIGCAVGDIAYIPIPARQDPMPALVTLKLPLEIKDGEQFKIDVQQHSGAVIQRDVPNEEPEDPAAKLIEVNFSERKVLGAFRLRVAVKIGEPLVTKLVRNLAVLRYIFQAIPEDSWRPVFERYIGQLSDQIKDLGVDPDSVPASADDPSKPRGTEPVAINSVTGKVSEVIFDCFGNFEGFVLDTCECFQPRFNSTQRGIGELVLRALKDDLLITVYYDSECNDKITEIIVRAS